MEQYGFLLPLSLFVLIFGVFGYRYFRFGSLMGASLGARVARTLGEVSTEKTLGVRKTLRVHLLERELGQPSFVAVGETTSGMGSWQFRAMKLSAEEARKLARLLDAAANGADGDRPGRPAP